MLPEHPLQSPVWRPRDSIRAKVVGIARHNNRLLVCEVLDDDGRVKGWCPLGGGIEFGETAEAALKREMQEELGCGIQTSGPLAVYENIFQHNGVTGHEIVFALSVSFDDPGIYLKNRFQIREDGGSLHDVEWVEIARFRSGADILFPRAMADRLLNAE